MVAVADLFDEMRRIQKELGPPPPTLRISKHATAMPGGTPHTLDMQEMVAGLARRGEIHRVPAAYEMDFVGLFGQQQRMLVIHPHIAEKLSDECK